MEINKDNTRWHKFYKTCKYTLLLMTFLFVYLITSQVQINRYFPIKTVRVYGATRSDHQALQTLLLPYINNGFFSINVDKVRDRLLQIPWVQECSVRRVWPDQIMIGLVEREPIAKWNRQSVLSKTGDIFNPPYDSYSNHLPHLVGPIGKQLTLLQNFNQMNRMLEPIHARINYLELSPFYTWTAILDNGIKMQMGHNDILNRFEQFVKVYGKIVGSKANDVEYIDLRYSNGIAVRWKS
jgi:cell division protein FtsQ